MRPLTRWRFGIAPSLLQTANRAVRCTIARRPKRGSRRAIGRSLSFRTMPIMPAGSRCRITLYCGARTQTAGPSFAARQMDLSVASSRRPAAETQVGYNTGKQVKGRKAHAPVDSEGLPMRVAVHSAAIQDRDEAGLILDKIRRRCPRLELICADSSYNAWQVEAAVAKVPRLPRISASGATTRGALSFCRAAGSNAPFPGLDETGASPRISRTLAKPWPPS